MEKARDSVLGRFGESASTTVSSQNELKLEPSVNLCMLVCKSASGAVGLMKSSPTHRELFERHRYVAGTSWPMHRVPSWLEASWNSLSTIV